MPINVSVEQCEEATQRLRVLPTGGGVQHRVTVDEFHFLIRRHLLVESPPALLLLAHSLVQSVKLARQQRGFEHGCKQGIHDHEPALKSVAGQ